MNFQSKSKLIYPQYIAANELALKIEI